MNFVFKMMNFAFKSLDQRISEAVLADGGRMADRSNVAGAAVSLIYIYQVSDDRQ